MRRSPSGTSSSGYASADTKPPTSRPSSARSDLSRDKINNNVAYVRCSMTEEDLKKWQEALKIREEKLDLRESELAKVSSSLKSPKFFFGPILHRYEFFQKCFRKPKSVKVCQKG